MKAGIISPIRGGIISAVSSPAQVNRALICAALSDNESYIKCKETPDELNATIDNLKEKGAKIRYDGSGFEVVPIKIPASELMRSAVAETHKAKVFKLPGDIAYRTITGLLLTLPKQPGNSRITVEGREEFRSYTNMTIDMLDKFGVKIEREVYGENEVVYKIEGGQKYLTPGNVKVEGDWSNASVWLCAAALGGEGVICSDLNRYSSQGDKEVVNILERFGAMVAYKGDSVAVKSSNKRSLRIDASETPDIVPYIAVLAAGAHGRTVIHSAERVKLQESGMLNKISSTLAALGADIIENPDGLIIQGKSKIKGGTVSSLGDQRIAMMTAIASGICEDTVAINDAEAVSKTYPDFFDDFKKLGGKLIKNM